MCVCVCVCLARKVAVKCPKLTRKWNVRAHKSQHQMCLLNQKEWLWFELQRIPSRICVIRGLNFTFTSAVNSNRSFRSIEDRRSRLRFLVSRNRYRISAFGAIFTKRLQSRVHARIFERSRILTRLRMQNFISARVSCNNHTGGRSFASCDERERELQ